ELSAAEIADLVAFGEALVEGRTLEPEPRRFLVEHIEERAKGSPRYVSFYRTTAATLDRLAGRRFARLQIEERSQLIARHPLARSPAPGAAEHPGPVPREAHHRPPPGPPPPVRRRD